jgi:hypothetical protein
MSAIWLLHALHQLIGVVASPPGLDLDQPISPRRQSNRGKAIGGAAATVTRWPIIVATAFKI